MVRRAARIAHAPQARCGSYTRPTYLPAGEEVPEARVPPTRSARSWRGFERSASRVTCSSWRRATQERSSPSPSRRCRGRRQRGRAPLRTRRASASSFARDQAPGARSAAPGEVSFVFASSKSSSVTRPMGGSGLSGLASPTRRRSPRSSTCAAAQPTSCSQPRGASRKRTLARTHVSRSGVESPSRYGLVGAFAAPSSVRLARPCARSARLPSGLARTRASNDSPHRISTTRCSRRPSSTHPA